MAGEVIYSGRWSREDRAESAYHYLPVDVPRDAPGIEVSLSYDRSAGVIDLGCFGPAGFRGWSGNARERFVIAADTATPGYLAGPVEAGTWRVALGLHRIAVAGVPYRLAVRIGAVEPEPAPPSPPTPERPPRRDLPAPAGMRWLAGDLHAHSVHSDGTLTVDELACAAVERGLDFLAVTDHNTVSHHASLAAAAGRHRIALLPGQEVTTETGHANAFGAIGWVDFRRPAQDWVDGGGLVSINHPLAADCAWRQPLKRRPPLAEVWHWTWLDRRWGGPIAWWQAWGLDATPVGGSDFHDPAQGRPLGAPTTWVLCEGDEVLGALGAGRTAVSADRDAPVLLRLGDEVLALDADGTLLVDSEGRRSPVRGERAAFRAGQGPFRIDDHDGATIAICA